VRLGLVARRPALRPNLLLAPGSFGSASSTELDGGTLTPVSNQMSNEHPVNVTALPPRDPIFALAPELRLRLSQIDGQLVVNSREVSRVFFHRKHQRVLRKIMGDIWDMPMRPDCRDWFRLRADGSIDMTSDGLTAALAGWGFRNKRILQFNIGWVQLVSAAADKIEAKTGVNPITEGIKKFFPSVRWRRFTDDGRQCCDDCEYPLPAGPMLHDELWATIAEPGAFLCFRCTEKRLGRRLTQADLIVCAFNAGWISFDGVVAMQFARARQLLPLS
jgi:hypothetical protein